MDYPKDKDLQWKMQQGWWAVLLDEIPDGPDVINVNRKNVEQYNSTPNPLETSWVCNK